MQSPGWLCREGRGGEENEERVDDVPVRHTWALDQPSEAKERGKTSNFRCGGIESKFQTFAAFLKT